MTLETSRMSELAQNESPAPYSQADVADLADEAVFGLRPGSQLLTRRRWVLIIAAAAALLSTGGVVGAWYVKSPAQLAADTAPPTASILTAPVVSQVLSSTIVLRGDVSDGNVVSVTPTSVAATGAMLGTANPAQSTLVVTKVMAQVGQSVSAAHPLVEVSGRPVFALPGAVPAYRDLLPGETGPDVAQLQGALRQLGYGTGHDQSGDFGAGTQSAVARLYAAMGYPVPITGAATEAAVKSAQQAVTAQQQTVGQLQEQIAQAAAARTPQTSGPDSPQAQLAAATAALTQDQTAYAQAVAQNGPMLPMSEVVFMPTLPAQVASLPIAVGGAVKGPVITLSTGELGLTGYLDPSDSGLVKPGMQVQIDSESTGVCATGTIASIGALVTPGDDTSGSGGSGGSDDSSSSGSSQGDSGASGANLNGGVPFLPLAVTPAGTWNPLLAGQNVRITITTARTAQSVLTVPEAAVSDGADATTTVTVIGPGGAQHQIPVLAGASANGEVQVTPTVAGALTAGENVEIGR